MSSKGYPYPIAISRLSEGDESRESQNMRAIKWLIAQPGNLIVVVTPQKQFFGDSLKRLVARPGVSHLTWRGFSTGSLVGRRVLFAWPDRKHLNDLWGTAMDALAVIEWNEQETADWINDANPVQLLNRQINSPTPADDRFGTVEPLPNGVEGILEHIAEMAAGYSSGLKWNEEDKLKADMMNCPERWAPIAVDQLRTKCCELGMRPNDTDTIAGLLQRRKEGRRFNVQSSYRTFHFD